MTDNVRVNYTDEVVTPVLGLASCTGDWFITPLISKV